MAPRARDRERERERREGKITTVYLCVCACVIPPEEGCCCRSASAVVCVPIPPRVAAVRPGVPQDAEHVHAGDLGEPLEGVGGRIVDEVPRALQLLADVVQDRLGHGSGSQGPLQTHTHTHTPCWAREALPVLPSACPGTPRSLLCTRVQCQQSPAYSRPDGNATSLEGAREREREIERKKKNLTCIVSCSFVSARCQGKQNKKKKNTNHGTGFVGGRGCAHTSHRCSGPNGLPALECGPSALSEGRYPIRSHHSDPHRTAHEP